MYANPTSYTPQTGSLRRPLVMWLLAAVGSIGLILLIIGAPLALAAGHPLWGLTIYHTFSYVCHQIPERSFFIAGHQFGVCSRCTGLYAGFAAATVFYPLLRSLRGTEAPPRKWLFIAAAPLAIDFSLTFLGIWENTHSSRFITGALLGFVSVFYVMPGLLDLSLRDWGSKGKRSASEPATQGSTADMFPTPAAAAPSDYSAPHRRI
jgi:uncharacterized membrane protein